jgi:hypothetical protein
VRRAALAAATSKGSSLTQVIMAHRSIARHLKPRPAVTGTPREHHGPFGRRLKKPRFGIA